MSKRDYEKAALIAQEFGGPGYWNPTHASIVIDAFVKLFQGDNPAFDSGRFVRACSPGANVKALS